MYPILFDSSATSFGTNGIGRLSDAASCRVIEERNGAYELELEYPITGIHFSDLKNGNIIYAKPFQNGELQAFRIYKVVKKAKDLADIYARHITYQLSFIPVHPSFTATTASSALAGLQSRVSEDCPFAFSTNVTKAGTFSLTQPDSFRALLGGQEGSILDVFGGEYEWNNYSVTLHESRGADNGVTIVYGKNLIDLEQEENIENTITGIYPFWKTDGNQTTDDHTIYSGTTSYWNQQTDLAPRDGDVYIYTDHGSITNPDTTITYTPGYKIGDGETLLSALQFLSNEDERLLNVTTYIELDEKIVYSSNADNFPFKRSVVKDFSQEFDGVPSQQQLREYTQQYIIENNIGVPSVSLDVNFINLFETPDYKDVAALQTVKLCDTVTVVFPKLNISSKAKVNKTDYDVLKERYNEIEIGDPKSTFSNVISDQLKQVTYMPTQESMRNMIDRATGVLNSGTRGHVIINRNAEGWANEILFLDNENIESAANVLRINMNGIGFSSSGYVGPYYQSWTNDGHLTLGGINNHYGTLEILDEDAQPTLIVDKEGLKLLSLDYVGYLRNNKFYTDATFTTEIVAKRNRGYYDRITSNLYYWNGSSYVQNSDAGVIASMTHDGMNIKEGTIELLMDEEVGFKVDDNGIQLGEFEIVSTSRHMFQSMYGGVTGMSANINNSRELYLWAGYISPTNYSFLVNSASAYVMTSDRTRDFNIGDTLLSFEQRLDALENGGEAPCTGYGGGGGGGCSCDDGYSCYSPCFNDCETVCSGALQG